MMKQKIRSLFKEERGNIMVVFAGTLAIMIFFIGLSLDVGLLAMERNIMQNLTQVIREDRFTFQDTIRYADDPGQASYDIISDTMEKNGFDGTVKVYFYEKKPQSSLREYYIRTELSKEFSYYFARIFGLTTTTLTVRLDGGETYGEGGADMVWHPQMSPTSYNGSYTGQPGGGCVHDKDDIPSEWT